MLPSMDTVTKDVLLLTAEKLEELIAPLIQ